MFDIKTCFGQASPQEESKCSDGIAKLMDGLAPFDMFCMPGHKGELNKNDLTELDGGNIFPSSAVENAEKKAAKPPQARRQARTPKRVWVRLWSTHLGQVGPLVGPGSWPRVCMDSWVHESCKA